MVGKHFEVSKWYADCVADDGQCVIVYVVDLTWRGIHLSYASLLSSAPSGRIETKASIRDVSQPTVSRGVFQWRSPSFAFEGLWSSSEASISETIFSAKSGSVHWDCLQPLSDAKISWHGRHIHGLGYVELVRMTVPPWELPIRQLNWGRFLGSKQSVIWIDWQGEHSAKHIWVNGEPRLGTIGDFQLSIEPGTTLKLKEDSILREGALGNTVLNLLPTTLGRLPRRLLGVHEEKWRSRGEFQTGEAPAIQGWAIHEVVKWPA